MNNKILTATLMSLTATCAHAADTYFGMDVMQLTYEDTAFSEKFTTPLAVVKYGIQPAKAVSLEFRLGTGLSEDTADNVTVQTAAGPQTAQVRMRTDLMMGVYLKGTIPLTESIDVVGITGLTSHEYLLHEVFAGKTVEEPWTRTKLGYGAGLAYRPNERTSISAEYALVMENIAVSVTSLSLGVSMSF